MPEYEVDLYGSKASPSNFTATVEADNAHRAKELAVYQYGGRATYVRHVNWENPTIGADDDNEEVIYSSSSGSSSGGIGVILIAAIFFGFVTMCSSKDDTPRQQQAPQVQTISQP